MEKIKQQNKEILARFAEQKASIHRLWNIEEESAHLLFMLVLIRQAKYIVEIGTSNGYSTFWLAAAAERTGGTVHTIEVDDQRFNLAKANLKNMENIRQYNAKAEDILADFAAGIDFLFIDAGKPGYREYLALLEAKLTPGAVVIADNICSHPETTAPYRKYIENNTAFYSQVIHLNAGLQLAFFRRR
ncbi:MAG: class I SAM-dependent methyltransferase [Candidatus Cloacimonetes bacterium]|nr:class I SAM-dependent methyltransferase [Candidatus Cloacimonadota bacterium]